MDNGFRHQFTIIWLRRVWGGLWASLKSRENQSQEKTNARHVIFNISSTHIFLGEEGVMTHEKINLLCWAPTKLDWVIKSLMLSIQLLSSVISTVLSPSTGVRLGVHLCGVSSSTYIFPKVMFDSIFPKSDVFFFKFWTGQSNYQNKSVFSSYTIHEREPRIYIDILFIPIQHVT